MLSSFVDEKHKRWDRNKECRNEVYRLYGEGDVYYAGKCGYCGYEIVTDSLEIDVRTRDGDAPKTLEGLYLDVYADTLMVRCPQCRKRNILLKGFPSLEAVNAFFECLKKKNEEG